MLGKLNQLVEEVKGIATKLVAVAVPVAGALIACDILIGTKFNVLQRAASMIGAKPFQVAAVAAILFFAVKSKQ